MIRLLRRGALAVVVGVVALVALLAIEALIAIHTVPDDHYRAPPAGPRTFGKSTLGRPPLRYVVLGDSTATGRGAPYEQGFVIATARHLARRERVTLTNLGVTDSRIADVRRDQLSAAVRLKPDVVLVSAGANDVTGLTRLSSVRRDFERIADRLRATRCDVEIVVTGSPDVGSAPRLAQPLRTVAGWRTRQLNGVVEGVVRDRRLVLAPLAEQTGRRFRADRSLFAADGFHPSAEGYATWTPVIETAIDHARARGATRAACPSAAIPPRHR